MKTVSLTVIIHGTLKTVIFHRHGGGRARTLGSRILLLSDTGFWRCRLQPIKCCYCCSTSLLPQKTKLVLQQSWSQNATQNASPPAVGQGYKHCIDLSTIIGHIIPPVYYRICEGRYGESLTSNNRISMYYFNGLPSKYCPLENANENLLNVVECIF